MLRLFFVFEMDGGLLVSGKVLLFPLPGFDHWESQGGAGLQACGKLRIVLWL
jgi:hypothetical protein